MKHTSRRLLIVVLVLLLQFGLGSVAENLNMKFLTPAGGQTAYAAENKVTTVNLNLRTGPGTSYSIILTIPKGSTVSVLSTSNGWFKVTYKDTTGYVYSAYLASPTGTRYYTTAALNLRTGPSTNYSIILTMPKGAAVTVYSISNGWAKLSYSGTNGYASTTYLSKTAPSTEPTTLRKIFKGVTSYSGRKIAITFDDGATASQVDRVLTILDNYNAKSTFFFTGNWILSHPVTARKIVSRGHKMESHTISHPDLTDLSDSSVRYQLTRSREIIKDTVGTTSYLIRPPYGATSSRVERIAGEVGFKYMVMWSIDTDDYMSTTSTSEIISRAVAGASNNGILLLHPSHTKVIDALPSILRQLRDRGYIFVTVNSMLP